MPRRRINDGLPKYVRRRKYGVIYTPYLGREHGRTVWGRDINLGPPDMPVAAIWEAYERETRVETDTLRWLLSAFHGSAKFKALKPQTQKHYEGYREILVSYPMANGRPFGNARLDRIKRTAIQRLIDSYHAPIAINRMVQYLKSAWNWGLNRHEIPPNPCIGVELNKQEARTRYVTQDEIEAFQRLTSGYVPLFIELAYLCRARFSEVAAIKATDCIAEGLCVRRGKGSDGEITAWTPRLVAAVESCKAFNPQAPVPISGAYLIHDRQGQPIKRNTFQSRWGRAMRKWVKDGGERFTFHDLKAAGYSDQKVQSAGHRSEKMHRVYNRKLRIVEPPE